MESGRQTRRKSYPQPQTTSAQTTRASKDKQPPQDKPNAPGSPSGSSENSVERKPVNLKAKRKTGQVTVESAPTEPSSSEFPLETQKQSGHMTNIYPEDSKTTVAQRERKSPASGFNEEVSDETKKQIEMLFEIAQSSASKGDYNQAINIYGKIVKLNEKSTSAWIAMGHCYAVLGDNYKALTSYQQALSITPDSQKDDQLWYGIGLLYQKIEDWKNAETSFKNALKLNPSSAIKGEILYNLGNLMKAKGDPKEAARLLMSSILFGSFSIDKMVDILCTVGQAQEEMEELNEAMKTYKHALALDENNLKALQCAGWLSFQLDKTGESLEYLTKASLINDEDHNILYMQARCYLKLKQHSKAYDCLHKCITKEATNSMYWCSLGILFAEMNQLKSAHECFSNALKFNPKIPENYFNMGCLYELCCQLDDALSMHEKAIELQPNFQLAHNRRIGIYAQIKSEENNHLEVQFKHHKFTLSLNKDIAKEKASFLQSQASLAGGPLGNELKAGGFGMPTGLGNNENELKNRHNRENLGISNPSSALKNQSQLQLSGPQKGKPKGSEQLSSLPSLMFQGAQKNSSLSPLENQSLSFGNLTKNSFSDLGSIFNQSQLSSGLGLNNTTPFKQESQLLGLSLLKGKRDNELGLDAIPSLRANRPDEMKTATNDRVGREDVGVPNLQLNLGSTNESFKSTKGVAQPIVLKHDPQVLQGKEDAGKEKANQENKAQSKGSFKLTHKMSQGDDEDLAPQKKVKTDMITGSSSEKPETGTNKTLNLVPPASSVVKN